MNSWKFNYCMFTKQPHHITLISKTFPGRTIYEFENLVRTAREKRVCLPKEWESVPLNKIAPTTENNLVKDHSRESRLKRIPA
jgi:hypothetical protein